MPCAVRASFQEAVALFPKTTNHLPTLSEESGWALIRNSLTAYIHSPFLPLHSYSLALPSISPSLLTPFLLPSSFLPSFLPPSPPFLSLSMQIFKRALIPKIRCNERAQGAGKLERRVGGGVELHLNSEPIREYQSS